MIGHLILYRWTRQVTQIQNVPAHIMETRYIFHDGGGATSTLVNPPGEVRCPPHAFGGIDGGQCHFCGKTVSDLLEDLSTLGAPE